MDTAVLNFCFNRHRKFTAQSKNLVYEHPDELSFTGHFKNVKQCFILRAKPVPVTYRAMLKRSSSDASFRDEAKILRTVKSSSNILEFMGLWSFGTSDYGMMFEFSAGSLETEIRMRRLSMPSKNLVASVASHLLDALNYVHDAGIVIRSVTSESVFVVHEGPLIRLKLSDFGSARELQIQEFFGHVDPRYIHWLHRNVDADIASLCLVVLDFANLHSRKSSVLNSYLIRCRSTVPYFLRFADYLTGFDHGAAFRRLVTSSMTFFRNYGLSRYVKEQLDGYTPVHCDSPIQACEFESCAPVVTDVPRGPALSANLVLPGSARHPSHRPMSSPTPATPEPFVFEPPQFVQQPADSNVFLFEPPRFVQQTDDSNAGAQPFVDGIGFLAEPLPDSFFSSMPLFDEADFAINTLVSVMHAEGASFDADAELSFLDD